VVVVVEVAVVVESLWAAQSPVARL